MIRLNRNGFTLIELLAVLMLLAIIMGISGYSIVGVLKSSRENNYNLLIENINSAVEQYYVECKYDDKSSITCSDQITLGNLVEFGYLKGNSTNDDDTSSLINPKDNKNIDACVIKYSFSDGKIIIDAVTPRVNESCPTSY